MSGRILITISLLTILVAGFALYFAIQGNKDVAIELDAVNAQLAQLVEVSSATSSSIDQLRSESARVPAHRQQQVSANDVVEASPSDSASLDEIHIILQDLLLTVQELRYPFENDDALSSIQSEIQEMKRSMQSTPVFFSATLFSPSPEEIRNSKVTLLDARTEIGPKLDMLRRLRAGDARSDDVVRHLADVYYSTEDPNQRADIFRQLDGVTTWELRAPLLYAVENETVPEVREEAAETLYHYLPDPEVRRWLEFLAENDQNQGVRTQAAESLQRELSP